MGCCVSSEAIPKSREEQLLNVGGSKEASKLRGISHESRAPPPSAEEETVKEVLSETPKPKQEPNIAPKVKQEEVEETKPAFFAKIQENEEEEKMKKSEKVEKKQDLNGNNEEVMSEVSEIFSLSLSESVSTTTDKRDNEVEQEVRRQRVSRSPVRLPPQRNRDYVAKRDRVVAQSPTRRPEQSPARRNNGNMRLVQSRREEAIQATRRERRDPGESSGRRSRSPATTRSAAMGRSPSARRTNMSPGRVKTDPAESGNNLRKMEGRWQHSNNNNNNNSNNSSTNESLENPLVSLECFIFL